MILYISAAPAALRLMQMQRAVCVLWRALVLLALLLNVLWVACLYLYIISYHNSLLVL